jgi:hypothetical protein
LDEGGALPLDDVNATNPMEIDSTITNGRGYYRFDFPRNDYRVPGARYEVCELEKDGWLAHTPTCQTVRLPEWPGACVWLEPFVNQQVGHSESDKHDGYDKGDDHGKGDNGYGDNGHDDGYGDNGYGNDYGKDGNYDNGGHENGGYGNGDHAQCSTYHVVKAGEGLYEIGRAYQKSPQQMLDANPSVRNGEELWVYEGQRICIP